MTQALAKLLFPRVHPRLREKKLRFLLVAIGVGLGVSLVFGWTMYLTERSGPGRAGAVPDELPLGGSASSPGK